MRQFSNTDRGRRRLACRGAVLSFLFSAAFHLFTAAHLEAEDVPIRLGSFRVDFAYEEYEIELLRARRIDIRALPADEGPLYTGKFGFWCELRNADGAVVYRRLLKNPFNFDVEVHSLDKGVTRHRRVPVQERRGRLSVLVPAIRGTTLELFLYNAQVHERFKGPRRLIQVELKEQGPKTEDVDSESNPGDGHCGFPVAPGGGFKSEPVHINGEPAWRFNLVLVAEGYKKGELSKFSSDATSFANHLFSTPPYDGPAGKAVNVYRVDVESLESGADDPVACGGVGGDPDTYFDASFCADGVHWRLLKVDTGRVRRVVEKAFGLGWHQIIVLVNSSVYGANSYSNGVSVSSLPSDPLWQDVALHEMGHSWFALADEYADYSGLCGSDPLYNHYTDWEPLKPNVTIETDPAWMKWAGLVTAWSPWPSLENSNCTTCPPSTSSLPLNTVGLFEGALYHHCDIYRPQLECKMLDVSSPFCAVCRSVIREKFGFYAP